MSIPPLETERLIIRPFTLDDFDDIHRILDLELEFPGSEADRARLPKERREWLEWTVRNYTALDRLYQPPYGDRAVALRDSGRLIGACGLVPSLLPLGQIPAFRSGDDDATARLNVAEVGLYYAVSPAYQRQGYATEAARALVEYAFGTLRLKRIIATTAHQNAASMGVMRKLGMRVERNPEPDPRWFQVVGVLENRQRIL